jgi:hypothetical protein
MTLVWFGSEVLLEDSLQKWKELLNHHTSGTGYRCPISPGHRKLDGSNPEDPDRDDGAQHSQAGNRPTRRVGRSIGFRPVHH